MDLEEPVKASVCKVEFEELCSKCWDVIRPGELVVRYQEKTYHRKLVCVFSTRL